MKIVCALIVAFIGGVTVIVAADRISANVQKEIRLVPSDTHTDGAMSGVKSLADLAGLSDAIIIFRVVSARTSSIAPQGVTDQTGLFVSTAYEVRVLEPLRWPSGKAAPRSMTIDVPGIGDLDRGAYIQRFTREHARPLSPGATYLAFLREHSLGRRPVAPTVWIPATTDDQSFVEILGSQLFPRASGKLSTEISRMNFLKLFEEIKRLPKKGQK